MTAELWWKVGYRIYGLGDQARRNASALRPRAEKAEAQRRREMKTLNFWLKETGALSQKDRRIIESVATIEEYKCYSSIRYDPNFSYGAEKIERWQIRYRDGHSGWLITWSWGNTDGCGLEILAQDWDGICVVCGHDFFGDCLGNCTCLSCNGQAQALNKEHRGAIPWGANRVLLGWV